jgi:hypothetical protein
MDLILSHCLRGVNSRDSLPLVAAELIGHAHRGVISRSIPDASDLLRQRAILDISIDMLDQFAVMVLDNKFLVLVPV